VSLSLKLVESMGMQVSELASPGMPRPLALVAVTVKVSVAACDNPVRVAW
jgi:hypothetical protein